MLRKFVCFTLFLCGSLLEAQTSTGTLQGQVRDAAGAVVPDAKVTITNLKTGVTNELRTNAEGRYLVPFLLPGEYSLTVEKPGFRRFTQGGIKLDVQQNQSADVELAVGGATPWISGGRNSTSEITMDGTSIILPENNVSINTLAYTPMVDSVEEFSVITNTLAAEYGRTSGGVINVATKQGTNDLHGTLFEFLRNSELDANNFFSNKARIPRRAFQRNQFGGTIGGPVYLPKAYDGRNRTFFFFDYQGTRTRSASVFTTTVPLEEWKRGDFSKLRNASGAPILIYDPLTTRPDGQGGYTRDQFAGNRIPDSRIDPVARRLMQYFAAPNTTPSNPFTPGEQFHRRRQGSFGR